MPVKEPRTVVQQDLEGFQRQYGTLRTATLYYLDGRMPEELARSFERVVAPEFLSAVALTRLSEVITDGFAAQRASRNGL